MAPGKEIITSNGEVVPYEQEQRGMTVEGSRATAESQAGFLIAKQFPRDVSRALDNIRKACTSVALAESAEFSFPRGGTEVRGPTIKLLETIGQMWGNLISGIRELETRATESVVMTYCYDLETNRREERIFTVKHERGTKKGIVQLTDPRDISELIFNMGSRRERACMEKVIPRWIIDEAVDICRETIRTKGEPPNEKNIATMLEKFAEVGVDQAMLERRLQKKLKAITGPEFAQLRRIFKGIEDGASTAEQWFGEETITEPKEKTPEPKKDKKSPASKKQETSSSPVESDTTDDTTGSSGGDLPLGGAGTLTDQVDWIKAGEGGMWQIRTANGTTFVTESKVAALKIEAAVAGGELCEFEYEETPIGLVVKKVKVIG